MRIYSVDSVQVLSWWITRWFLLPALKGCHFNSLIVLAKEPPAPPWLVVAKGTIEGRGQQQNPK